MPNSSTTAKGHSIVSYILALIIPFSLVMGIQYFFFENYWVPSASMETTLMTGDRVFGQKLINYTPETGDIVVFKDDNKWLTPDGSENLVKRIVAVGGDTIECCSVDGKIIVNGQPVSESYTLGANENFAPQIVPEGYVFVMGDNREVSADSHVHISEGTQFISEDSLLSKVWAVWMPSFHLVD